MRSIRRRECLRTRVGARHFSKLHELIVAADMDLARMTYANEREFGGVLSRSGGSIAELMAVQLVAGLDEGATRYRNQLGALVRATEIVRDARQDAYEGRLISR